MQGAASARWRPKSAALAEKAPATQKATLLSPSLRELFSHRPPMSLSRLWQTNGVRSRASSTKCCDCKMTLCVPHGLPLRVIQSLDGRFYARFSPVLTPPKH